MKKQRIWLFLLAAVCLLFVKSCIYFTEEDYRRAAEKEFQTSYVDFDIDKEELSQFKYYGVEENKYNYWFSWYALSDTNDTMFISIQLDKIWPYLAGSIGSFSLSMLEMPNQGCGLRKGKWKRSLSNLFDTTVVNDANVSEYVQLLPSDTIKWTVDKEKIVTYIRKGYYDVRCNTAKPMIIEFYNPVGITEKAKYSFREVAIIPQKDNSIKLTLEVPADVDRWSNRDCSLIQEEPVLTTH